MKNKSDEIKTAKVKYHRTFTIKQIVITTIITLVVFISGVAVGVDGSRAINQYIDSQVEAKVKALK